jgi:hypothetical protein
MFVLCKWKRIATAGYGKGDEREGWDLRKKICKKQQRKGNKEPRRKENRKLTGKIYGKGGKLRKNERATSKD